MKKKINLDSVPSKPMFPRALTSNAHADMTMLSPGDTWGQLGFKVFFSGRSSHKR